MTDVQKQLTDLAKKANELVAKSLSEADTKAVLIEPVLSALGWDTHDPDEVKREHQVYDGTTVDYALRLNLKPRLYMEAKKLGEKLDNFAAKTINYANNDGIEWCVLTDGNVWRVYKSNAAGNVSEKLLFEVRLTDLLTDEASEALVQLQSLSRESIKQGNLDEHFADRQVGAALERLLSESSPKLVNLLYSELNKQFPKTAVKAALQRRAGQKPQVATKIPRKAKGGKTKAVYDYNHHFVSKPSEVRELYDQLDKAIMQLASPGVIKRTFQKLYIAYSVKKNFVEVRAQKKQLKLFVELPYADVPDKRNIVRDVSEIGHWGTGNTEVQLHTSDDLDHAVSIIQLAYEQTPK